MKGRNKEIWRKAFKGNARPANASLSQKVNTSKPGADVNSTEFVAKFPQTSAKKAGILEKIKGNKGGMDGQGKNQS